jgi:hypothetical protein
MLKLLISGYILHGENALGEKCISWGLHAFFATERELGVCWARQQEQTDRYLIHVMLTVEKFSKQVVRELANNAGTTLVIVKKCFPTFSV